MSEQSRTVSVAAIGDVNLDIVCDIHPVVFGEIQENVSLDRAIHVKLGGTGASFALAAATHFSEIRLIGAIGTDAAGALVQNLLAEQNINARLQKCYDAPTRTVLLLRGGGQGSGLGNRLLITPSATACERLTRDFIQTLEPDTWTLDCLFVSGYSLLSETSRSAVSKAIELSAQHSQIVAMDVVPHKFSEHFIMSQLRSFTEAVDILIVEALTLLELNGVSVSEHYCETSRALDSVESFRRMFPGKWLLLRAGPANICDSIIVSPEGATSVTRTGFAQASQPWGFGDRLTVSELEPIIAELTRSRGKLRGTEHV